MHSISQQDGESSDQNVNALDHSYITKFSENTVEMP